MSNTLIYPSATSAPSVETMFIEGVKFDICEVVPGLYNMLQPGLNGKKPGSRFFICVEDNFICRYSASEQYFKETGQARWDFFAMGRAECRAYVLQYEESCNKVARLQESMSKRTNSVTMYQPMIDKENDLCIQRFGIKTVSPA